MGFSNAVLAGAHNCVVECGGVRKGDHVLILNLTQSDADPVEQTVVDALATVCQEVGAKPQVLWATGMEAGWWDDPSPVIMGAFLSADVVINNTISIGRPLKAVRDAMFQKGVRMVRNMATTTRALSSPWARFPYAVLDEILHRTGERLDAAKRFHVRHANGTDIGGEIGPPPTAGTGATRYAQYRRQMANRPFPMPVFNPTTCLASQGMIVFERTIPWEARHVGVPEMRFSEPLRIMVEGNRMIRIEGGPEAQAYRAFYEEISPALGDDAWMVSSFHGGIHPKVLIMESADKNPDIWFRGTYSHTSNFHFHLGGSLGKEYDFAHMWHLSNIIIGASVYLDGEPLYQDGHLTVLDDPAVREIAERYGDASDLLRESDFPLDY